MQSHNHLGCWSLGSCSSPPGWVQTLAEQHQWPKWIFGMKEIINLQLTKQTEVLRICRTHLTKLSHFHMSCYSDWKLFKVFYLGEEQMQGKGTSSMQFYIFPESTRSINLEFTDTWGCRLTLLNLISEFSKSNLSFYSLLFSYCVWFFVHHSISP